MSFETVLQSIFTAAFIATIIRISTPLILPALGGLISELAGGHQHCSRRHYADRSLFWSGRWRSGARMAAWAAASRAIGTRNGEQLT